MTGFHRSAPWLAACLVAFSSAASADWQAVEKVETYAISGSTGAELYASIGERGPLVGGNMRTIAHTKFDLKWSRKYEPQGNACRLVSARPWLVITYTLPKPSGKLTGEAARRWETFIEGITRHEKVHGEQMKAMVDTILATTVGLTVADDRKCEKIRKEITRPLSAASQAQRDQSRDFDKVEMSSGGNVHRLILGLVNGR